MFGSVACGLDCVHCVGGAIVTYMKKARVLPKQVERIISISLQAFSSVYLLSSISVKHGPSTILHCKPLRQSLTKSIKVLAIELSPYLNIVVTIKKSADIGRKEDCVVGLPYDLKIKGISRVFK